MLDFPSNPAHNQKLTSGKINFWYDQNLPAWQRYEVTAPPPMSLNSLDPTFAIVNAPDFTLNCIGTSYPTDAVIQTNGNPVATTYVSDTSLTALMTAAGMPGTTQISVQSASMNKTTAELPFEWAATLALVSITPTEAVIGDPDFTLIVAGAGFVADCVIQVGGVDMPTTVVSATRLTTTLSSAAITAAGPVPITVSSPGSAQITTALDFNWRLAPILTSMAPTTAAVAIVTVNLVVTGENFSSVAGEETVIYQGGKALPNTVVASATSCSVTIVAPRLPQTEEITVANGSITTRSPPLIFTWT